MILHDVQGNSNNERTSEARLSPLSLGPVPSHWSSANVGELTHLLTNGFVGECLPFQTDESSGMRYLQGFNVRPNNVDLSKGTWVTREFHLKNKRNWLREGDVLIVQSGHVGTSAVVPAAAAGASCHALIIARFKTESINPHFVSQYLNSEIGKARLRGLFVGSSLPHINTSEIGRFRLPIPPIVEQQRIVEILSAWDDAAEKLELLISAKEELKSKVMDTLLTGERRLCRSMPPWSRFRLRDLFTERIEINHEELPLLSITREEGVVRREEVDRKDTSSNDKSRYLRICPGDIGYNTMRMWQGVSALSPYEGIISPAYTVCIPGPHIDARFAAYLFKLPRLIHLFYRYSQGLTSDTWNLKFHHFGEIQVSIPCLDEQIAIASALANVDEELVLLNKQRDVLIEQKRGLTQKMLTGEWRIGANSTAQGM